MPGMEPFYKALPCEELATFYNSTQSLVDVHRECENLSAWVPVKADLAEGSVENAVAALNLTFGMAAWLALVIHAIGIEVYVCSLQLQWLLTFLTPFSCDLHRLKRSVCAMCRINGNWKQASETQVVQVLRLIV